MKKGQSKGQSKENMMISLEIEKDNSVKFESLEEFPQSFFCDTYYDAFVKTGRLIEWNQRYREELDSWKYDRVYNIIPFWGARGTGKTSVMRSFLGALDLFKPTSYQKLWDHYKEINRENKMPTTKALEDCEFICLECIDAALLTKNEDIFQVILAKMLEQIVDKGYALPDNKEWQVREQNRYIRYRKSDVYARFETIYSHLRNIKNMDKDSSFKSGAGAVEILSELSGSLDLRETFKKLVPVYLNMMAKNERSDKKRFLVISVDDLDMHKCGYDILEQIHRYFMVPDVLIYVAVSGAELMTMCDEHFISQDSDEASRKRQERLAKSYIDKVLPFANRVYLPELISKSERTILKPNGFPIKKTLLWKIARRTKVYFDGCGKKVHFYEPDDLRTLVNTWALLEDMDVLGEDWNYSEYQRNVEHILSDVMNRLPDYKLNGKQRETFRDICQMTPSRQGIAFLQYAMNQLPGEFTQSYAEYGYSYGEFLKAIYIFGRKHAEDKALVHCMLALETVSLTSLFQASMQEGVGKEKYKNQLFTAIGDSVSGSWADKFVPELKYEGDTNLLKAFKWAHMKGELNEGSIIGFYKISDAVSKKSAFEKIKRALNDDKLSIVKTMELFFLFFTKHQMIKDEDVIKIKISEKVENLSQDGDEDPGKSAGESTSSSEEEKIEEEVPSEAGSVTQDGKEAPGKSAGQSTSNSEKEKIKEEVPDEADNVTQDGKEDPGKSAGQSTSNSKKEKIEEEVPGEASSVTPPIDLAKKEAERIEFVINPCKGTFDVLGFVLKGAKYKETLNEVHKGILSAIKKCYEEKKVKLEESEEKEIQKLINQKSLFTDFDEWKESYKSYWAMPVYSTDIMYNVLKRVKKKQENHGVRIIEKEDILKSIKKMLENIQEELKNEDEFFNKILENEENEENKENKGKTCGSNFEKTFTECPAVKALLEQEDYVKGFEQKFNEIVYKLSKYVNIEKEEKLSTMKEEVGDKSEE